MIGGFSYESVLKMPSFEREFHHREVARKYKDKLEFLAALHDAKVK